MGSHWVHSSPEGLVAVEALAAQLISLHLLPDLARRHCERINIAVVGVAVREDYVTCVHLGSVNRFIAHSFSNEAIKLANHLVSGVWVDVPLRQSVGDLAVPDFTSDELWVDMIVSDDVHIIPPPIKEIVVVLVVHSHIENVHSGQVAGRCRADHLTVMYDSVVSCAHGVQMLIALVRDEDDLAHPLALANKLFDVLLTRRTSMRADHCDKVFEGASLRRE